jgi:putative transposase
MTGLKKRLASLIHEQAFSPHDLVTKLIDHDPTRTLPLTTQSALLNISRSSLYYEPLPPDPALLKLLNLADKIHTDWPAFGAREMAAKLTLDLGKLVGRKQARTLMEMLGVEAIYPKPHLSLNGRPHAVYPYLLKGLTINQPNQVWGMDITYIRLRQGFIYLTAILDWYSRFVVGWQFSTTLEADFCIEAAKTAIATWGPPGIINVDQGVQFTSDNFIGLWDQERTKISMDHKGRCFDNIFTERLWWTVKYNEVYLKDYQTVREATGSISRFLSGYDYERPHSSLNGQTPAMAYGITLAV